MSYCLVFCSLWDGCAFGPVFRVALHVFFALLIFAGFGLIYKGDSNIALGIGFLAVGVYWFVLRRFEQRWTVRRQFRKRPDRDIEIEWQVSADKIKIESKFGQSEVGWQTFAKMVRTPTGVMLYPINQIFHWLPRTGFASDSEFESCVELARSKIERCYEVA